MYFRGVVGGRLSPSSLNSKKGQVTVFIIIGILLVLAVALFLLLRSEQIGFQITEIIPTEKGSVETYISSCISQVGEEALTLAGLQGGYIEVPDRYTDDLSWNIDQGGFIIVPLWSSGNIVDRPELSEVKDEVDEYIEEHVRNCLFENDDSFEDSYTLIELDDIQSDVKFEDSFTDFDVTWDVIIQDKTGEVISEVIEHNARSSVKFKQMYETADAILEAEIDELKLEDITQDLIALEHENVPVAGVEFSCSPKQWSVSEVRSTLKEMLRINIRALRVQGSSFTDYSDLYPYYQNHYVWNVDEGISDDVSVTFRFEDNYPFTFQVTPTSGGTLRSNQLGGGDLLDFLCIQSWKFTYDLAFPVLVQVYDEETDSVLQMGLSVNIIRNYPNKDDVIYARESYFTGLIVDEEAYCQESSYVLPVSVTTYSEISNGVGGVYYRDTLEGVNVSYTCIKYRCEMGESEYDFEQRGDIAGLSALIPYCAGGILRGEKDGYLESWIYTDVQEWDEHELNLRPLLSFPLSQVELVKHKLASRDCEADEEEDANGLCVDVDLIGESLSDDETALVTINLLEDAIAYSDSEEDVFTTDELEYFALTGSGNEVYSTEFVVSSSFEEEFLDEAYVDLLYGADFEYDVTITLVNEEEVIGGFSDKVQIAWSGLEESEVLRFHVFEIDTSDDYFYTLVNGIEEYGNLVPGVEVE